MSTPVSKSIIVFSTKADGSMKSKDGTNDLENIKKFLKAKSLSSEIVTMQQIHSGVSVIVRDNSKEVIKDVDGLITAEKNLSLCVITADCLPILFVDRVKGVIGAAHAGSKGLRQNILHNVVEKIRNVYASDPKNLQVTIGPGIEKRCYEVGPEVIQSFTSEFPWFDKAFYEMLENNHYLLDLRKIAMHCLLKEGILKENITVADECTKCSIDTRYSYRRGNKTERFVSVICRVA